MNYSKVYYDIFDKARKTFHLADEGDTDRVYSLIMAITNDHDTAANVEGWCSLASVGEIFEHDAFTVSTTQDL